MSQPKDTTQDAASKKNLRDRPRSDPAVGFAPGWPSPWDLGGTAAANDDAPVDAVLGWPLPKRGAR